MSTLAEELLQDFEDSGSENGEEQNDTGLDLDGPAIGPPASHDNSDMVLDGDEEEPDEDEEMGGVGAVEPVEDEEATKAKVEKMQLGGVKDIRKVTTVMDRLDPLLKVSLPSTPSLHTMNSDEMFTSPILS